MVTMTWVGLDVHARSTEAAAIDVLSGELSRQRFGGGVGPVVAWLAELPQPVAACYEAGPTGYGLYRAVCAAGLGIEVIAPSKTPRASGERVKSDRKDAELLARLLAAGALSAVGVPSAEAEAARDLSRARDQLRCDLMRSRHRVSKLLLRQGRVYEGGSTWNQVHRRWLAAQRFEHEATELAYLDALAAVDGLTARREVLDERLSRLATTEAFWPTVARLRCFRGIDTLSALALHLEVCDWQRFRRDHQDRLVSRPPAVGRGGQTLRPPATHRGHATEPSAGSARLRPADRLARPASSLSTPGTPARTRQTGQRGGRGRGPRAGLLSVGGSRGCLSCDRPHRPVSKAPHRESAGMRDRSMGSRLRGHARS